MEKPRAAPSRRPRRRSVPHRKPHRRTPGAPAGRASGTALGFYGYRVGDIMSRPPVTVGPDDPLRIAAARMSQRRVSGLPVVDARHRVVGVISHKDVVRVLRQRAELALPTGLFDLLLDPNEAGDSDLLPKARALLDHTRVREAMSAPAVVIDASASIDEGVRRLIQFKVNRLPVVRGGELVGIVTRHDLLTSIGQRVELPTE